MSNKFQLVVDQSKLSDEALYSGDLNGSCINQNLTSICFRSWMNFNLVWICLGSHTYMVKIFYESDMNLNLLDLIVV